MDGRGPGPALYLMRFSFEVPFEHEWNQEIMHKFIARFEIDNEMPEDDIPTVVQAVKQLYTNLRRYVSEANLRDDEDELQAGRQVRETEAMRLKSNRRFTRKRTVSIHNSIS